MVDQFSQHHLLKRLPFLHCINLLEENIGKILSDINHSRILNDQSPRIMEIKAKINKWDLIKLKKLLHSEENYKQGEKAEFRMRENNRKWSNWQRINLKNIQATPAAQFQKNKWPNQKMGQRTKQIFLQEDIQMANKNMKRCSTSLIIRKMQTKITMRYHLMPIRMAVIKKSSNNKCWRRCGEKGTLLHCWWECKLV